MSETDNSYAVRPTDTEKPTMSGLRKLALDISAALARLAKRIVAIEQRTQINKNTTASGSTLYNIQFIDPLTGNLVFLPEVRFVSARQNEGNVGFELDVSGAIGGGIGGPVQGYMVSYGQNGGEKLVSGFLGNNEDTAQPRVDVGFKSKRGAAMEMYASAAAGEPAMSRDGQLRMTIGPTGYLAIFRYISGDSWECVGGIDLHGRVAAGWKNYNFPTSTQLPHPICVYAETGLTTTPVAYIDKAGALVVTGLTVNGKTYTPTLAVMADSSTKYVLAAPV